MRLLLDTHAFLWRVTGSTRLSSVAETAISDPANVVFVSAASAWEIATKHRLGKLPGGDAVVAGWIAAVRQLGADELAMTSAHSLLAGSFDNQHRDPFDRMLAAQAATEALLLVSVDSVFRTFPVTTLW